MKKSMVMFPCVLFVFFQTALSAPPDEWSGPRESVLLNNWSINLSIGATSYFGDLSQYDWELKNKLLQESKMAYGLKLTKHIRRLNLSGQLIYAGFKSGYRPDHSFETRLLEYSLQSGIELLGLIRHNYNQKVQLEVYVGIGQFMFTTAVDTWHDGTLTRAASHTGVPEFVYFFGGELSAKMTERLRFTTNLSIRQVQNDNIDKYLRNNDFDYYSLFNIGITYRFGAVKTSLRDEPLQKVNNGRPVWRIPR